jgi:HD-GYP domain-containing protein (c-di-GMP phosphodiesterase class II)
MKTALKLHRAHLTVGKPLPWDVYDSVDQLLLVRGFVIANEPQLAALLLRGMYVDIAEFEAAIEKAKDKHFDPFWSWDQLVAKLGYQLAHPNVETGFAHRICELARLVQTQAQRGADATLAIILLTGDHRRYSTVHSLQVAVLCEMVANRLGWEKQRRLDVICAALTMNLAMHELQQHLSIQPTPISTEQRLRIRQHPSAGAEMLRKAGVDSPIWLTAVENHHETASGNGYPRGITEVDEESSLLRTLDVFCAKISARMHRKPLSGTQAERVLFKEAEVSGNNPFIPTLIKEIGIYPPGTFVKLLNGETAIVLKRSSAANAPHVLSLLNGKGEALIEPVRRDTSRDNYKIAGDVQRDAVTIKLDPAKIWSAC